MNSETMKLLLAIEQRDKAIPYPPEEREDGTKNSGFRVLKGASEREISAIPEVQDCAAFRRALIAINAPTTPFFTVGCEKCLNRRNGQFWKKGYLEFAYNQAEMLKDAVPYFQLFFHFDRASREFVSTRAIQFLWELQQANFVRANVAGFSCCVWITTSNYPTVAECEKVWDDAVDHLTQYVLVARLRGKAAELPSIYGPSGQ